MMFSRYGDEFTVFELKELLKSRNLSTADVKAELIARLYEDHPSGQRMGIFHRSDDVTGSEGAGRESNRPCISANNQAVQDNRKLDFLRREKCRFNGEGIGSYKTRAYVDPMRKPSRYARE
ncbi:hypothetical protein KM043_013249 [Ampulex compressa]|nr:hypothetical protein KM043_013249 [Ampulex compressa]